MSVRPGQNIARTFITRDPYTLLPANASSTPAGALFINGAPNAAAVTVTNLSPGHYKAAVTLPALSIGDGVELLIEATVNGSAGKEVVWEDAADIALDADGRVTTGTIADDAITSIRDGVKAWLLKIVRLVLRRDAAVATDHAAELGEINADAGSGAGAYDNTTDSQEAIRDRGDAAWVTGATAAEVAANAVNLVPLQASLSTEAYRSNGVRSLDLSMFQGERKTFVLAITDQNGVPIDLVGKSLRFLVRDNNTPPAGKFEIETGANLTVGGADSNQVAVIITPAESADTGKSWYWELWNTTDDKALGYGKFKIAAALKDVP